MDTSEQHRFRCEVRLLLFMRKDAGNCESVDAYVGRVAEKRGQSAADRLLETVFEQWSLGNRGAHGDWRETQKEAA